MGFGDFVRKETRRVLNNLLSQQPGNITPPGLNNTEFITFTNGERTKGKTDSGIEVDTIAIGMPRDRDLGIKVGSKQYLVRGKNVRYRSIDQSKDEGLWLYQGFVDDSIIFYVRKAKSRKFYRYTPPTINTHVTIPAPIESGLPDNDMRLSSGFFKSKSQWFNYLLRYGPEPGLNTGDIGIDWAYVSPTFTDVDTITNTISSSGSFTFNSGGLSTPPNPTNNNTFVMSSGYEETATAPSGSTYTWTVSDVLTYGNDTDLGAVSEYNAVFSNNKQPQLGAMVLNYSDKIDICLPYTQSNSPFQAKILNSRVTTFHGTFRTVFSETYGPDVDNLTTTLTPMQGEWEAVTSTVYSYGPSIDGERTRTATTTYSITVADLLEYTPLGTGQAIDILNAGGPKGSIDLVANPSPPFGYLEIYCHPPLEIDATFGSVTSTALYFLTQATPAFVMPLADVENNESPLDDLPFSNTISVEDTIPGYYSNPDLPISRTQTKLVTLTNIMGGAELTQTVYFDTESWTTQSATSNSDSGDFSFGYSNVFYGGSSAYNAAEDVSVSSNSTGWESDGHFQINNNYFNYFGTFLGAPIPKNAFKTTDSNGEVYFTGLNAGLTAIIQNRSNFSLSTNSVLDTTPQFFPFIKWHPINSVINQVVDQISTFGVETGNFHVPRDSNKITVFKFSPSPEVGNVQTQSLAFWSFSEGVWTKGKEIEEIYSEEPLVYPAGVTSPFNVNQFALF